MRQGRPYFSLVSRGRWVLTSSTAPASMSYAAVAGSSMVTVPDAVFDGKEQITSVGGHVLGDHQRHPKDAPRRRGGGVGP